KKLLSVQEDGLSEDQQTWLVANESAITERIDRFLEGSNHDRIWRDWDRGERLVRVLREAVTDVDDDTATVGTFHSAQALYDALAAYEPEASWKQRIQNRVSSPRSLGNLLVSQQDHRSLTVEQDRETNQYRIDASSRGAHPITVDSIEDLFELPCMANMAERLQEKKPVRKDLYNFVRMVMWLPQYQESSLDEIVDDLKDVFSQWPWYDEQTTDYQIRYEFSNTIDGETPLPMNCDNDDLQRYCIGQDQCDYSIWGSVPFPDEMYDQLDESDSTSEF
ncbi:primase-associated protein, partial [Halarchaeum acidiphilum]|uniref:primase-associated protein n=2 Tax=Halarchaeum acidiphilum TaxID=489138 RepID=UPI0019011089